MLPYISPGSVQSLLTISLVVVQRIARIQKTFIPLASTVIVLYKEGLLLK